MLREHKGHRALARYSFGAVLMILLARDGIAYEPSDKSITLYEKDYWSAVCRDVPTAEKRCSIIYDGIAGTRVALSISGTHAFIIFDGVPETAAFSFAFDDAAPWPQSCRRICYLAGEDFARWHETLLASHALRIESPALQSSQYVHIDLGNYTEALARVRAFNAAD